MASIYKYAVVTIASAFGKSCHDGFLNPRHIRSARIPYIRPDDNTQDGRLLLQLTDKTSGHWHDEISDSWWSTRGWTLQEWLLSRRLLQFSASRTYFECNHRHFAWAENDETLAISNAVFDPETLARADTASGWESDSYTTDEDDSSDLASSVEEEASSPFQTLQRPDVSNDTPLLSEADETHDEYDGFANDDNLFAPGGVTDYEIFYQWYTAIQLYSHRSLTYSDDKFPAVEGLAREAAANCKVGRYLCGLWEHDLALGLMWKPVPWDTRVDSPFFWPPLRSDRDQGLDRTGRSISLVTTTAPGTYRAPSWSWASFDGRIHWPFHPQNKENVPNRVIKNLNGAVELLDVKMEFEGKSVFGRVKDARLVLRARCCKVTVSGPQSREQQELRPDYYIGTGEFDHVVHNDAVEFAYAAFDWGPAPPGELYALKLVNQPPGAGKKGSCTGLMLQHSQDKPGAFRRVGTLLLQEGTAAFDDITPEPITLV